MNGWVTDKMVSISLLMLAVACSIDRTHSFVHRPQGGQERPSGENALVTTRRNKSQFRNMRETQEDEMPEYSPSKDVQIGRRNLFATSLLTLSSAAFAASSSPPPALAYDKTFPGELQAADGILDERQMKQRFFAQRQRSKTRSVIPEAMSRPLGALLWGSALWFLSGSRSNPLVTPIANVLYDDTKEGWLKDRNDGLFANLPLPLFAVLVIIFFAFGVGTDNLLTLLSQGNHNASLQLAGVTLMGAGTLELGRIASGEKKLTRQESNRDAVLETEFDEFAAKRLRQGGNCHRNEVVAAFRRFYAKYRQADSETYPLADLEIEQLLRTWCRSRGVEMTSAGFYYGIKINKDADVFA